MAAGLTDPWKESGFFSGVGIPAPSGRFAVGCVDLMHRLDGDEEGGLLVRLFYPTASPKDAAAAGEMQRRYPYAEWVPNPRYSKGYAAIDSSMKPNEQGAPGVGGRPSWITEFVARLAMMFFKNPKIPAHEGAPVLSARAPPPGQPDTSSGAGLPSSKPNSQSLSETSDAAGGNILEERVTAEPELASQGSKPPSFPVIVLSHGLGAMRTMYCSVCCDLASHGYLVAAVEHRDGSACVSNRRVPHGTAEGTIRYSDEWLPFYYRQDNKEEFPLRNRQVHQRANDVKRSLDLLSLLNKGARIENMMDGDFDFSQFKGRIDVGTAAVMGHSFGGATTVQTLSEDPRFSCGIALDGWMVPIHRDLNEVGLQHPLLFINSSDHFQWVKNVQQMMKLSRAPDENGMSTCRVVTLRDSNHMSQCDAVFVVPKGVLKGKMNPTRDQTEVFSLNMELCHSFLRRHLLRDPKYVKPVPNLDGLAGHPEYLIFGTNLDLGTGTVDGRGKGGATDAQDNIEEAQDS